MVFADTKDLQAHVIGELNLFQEVLHPLDRTQSEARRGIGNDCPKAVDTDLHIVTPPDLWFIHVPDATLSCGKVLPPKVSYLDIEIDACSPCKDSAILLGIE